MASRGPYGPTGHHRDVRILVVEDEPTLADMVAKGLRRQAFAVDVVYDGAAALAAVDEFAYDVVVLDRDLPAVHGDEVCRHIVAEQPATRTLMLTAAVATSPIAWRG
jgi:DNA-binding response OmpR family regulator